MVRRDLMTAGFDWLSHPLVRPKGEPLGPFLITKEELEPAMLPITRVPENIVIVVAGGAQSEIGFWIQASCCPTGAESSEIKLPANWNGLLKEAEKELGPLPGKDVAKDIRPLLD